MFSMADHMRPWHEWPIAVIDFETTGVDPRECRPVEVAVVRFESGAPVGRWSSVLNPEIPIPAEAAAIHGITDEMVADAPTVTHMMTAIQLQAGDLLNDAMPCGYNGQTFDRVILHRYSDHARRGWPATNPALPWLDPLVIVRDIDKFVAGSGRHRLAATCKRWGVELEPNHRALGDAEACGRLLFKMKDRIGSMTISELLRKQAIRAAAQEQERAAWLAQQPKQEQPST